MPVEEKKVLILEYLSGRLRMREAACRALGISRAEYCRWRSSKLGPRAEENQRIAGLMERSTLRARTKPTAASGTTWRVAARSPSTTSGHCASDAVWASVLR